MAPEHARGIINQHEELERRIDRLRLILAAPPVVAENRVMRILAVDWAGLCELLEYHFAFEEEDGYMGGVVDKAPHLERDIATLEKQHVSLLEEARACFGIGDGLPTDELRAAMVAVLDHIERHEMDEVVLLERYLVEELGSGE